MRALAQHDTGGAGAHVFRHLGGVTNLAIAVGDLCLFTRPLSATWDGEAAASMIADEIRLSLDYYMTPPGARGGRHRVVMPGVQGPGLRSRAVGHIGLDASVAQPLGRFREAHLPGGEIPERFTVAAGLAMGETA